MELIIYNTENCVMTRSGDATFRVTMRGDFSFTASAVNLLKLKNGDRLEVANEKGTKNWYIRKTDNNAGFFVCRISTGLGIRNKELSKVMMRDLRIDTSASFLITKNTVKIDGEDYYQLITSRPIIVTKGKSKKDNHGKVYK